MITIPRKAAEKTGWKAGDIIEFVPVLEGSESYVKIRKVTA
jgi:bifunctional DNA-binding transcriptional regulator/antitoxin component of YhaV-PrlF toxin-antitoxin module